MSLKTVLLRERSQTRKSPSYVTLLTKVLKNSNRKWFNGSVRITEHENDGCINFAAVALKCVKSFKLFRLYIELCIACHRSILSQWSYWDYTLQNTNSSLNTLVSPLLPFQGKILAVNFVWTLIHSSFQTLLGTLHEFLL